MPNYKYQCTECGVDAWCMKSYRTHKGVHQELPETEVVRCMFGPKVAKFLECK